MLTKVILQANIDKVAKYFERADKIVIVTHVSPDGDALGSSLGVDRSSFESRRLLSCNYISSRDFFNL